MNSRLKIKKIRFSWKELYIFLLIIPFFKLLSIGSFQDQDFHKSFFKLIGYLYDGGRIIAGTIGYILFIKNRFKFSFSFSRKFAVFFLIEAVSCIANRSLDVFIAIKIYAYIGFVLLLDDCFSKRGDKTLREIRNLFGGLSILAVITTIIFPLGFLHGERVYEAVYLLGGKNASFPFYYMFLISWFLLYTINDKKHGIPQWGLCIIALMMVAAFICQSVNSLVALALIAIITVLYTSVKPRIGAIIPTTILFTLLSLIYVGTNIPVIEKLLASLGRNSTFSYRTILWEQAFSYISANPVFGSGYQLEYKIGELVTDHAHSTYLDMFSKYGIVAFIPFIFLIYLTIKNTYRIKYAPLKCYIGLFLVVYLFHMGFDDYNFNFQIFILMLVNYISYRQTGMTYLLLNKKITDRRKRYESRKV